MKIKDCEYITLTCKGCLVGTETPLDMHTKFAKNKGNYFSVFEHLLEHFLLMHGDCDIENLTITYEESKP